MKRMIAVTKEVRERLSRVFGVTERTVWGALNMEREGNLLHRKIRKAALAEGGVVMVTTPEAETLHDTGSGWRQYLGNGVVIEADFGRGTVEVWKDGRMAERHAGVSLTGLEAIQRRAERL